MKKFPIGIQTFSKIIESEYYYIDKTPLIAELVNKGEYYFLSRPRRFGKSLLVSTLSSAFKGEDALFKGLYLEKNWDWSQQYPVIDISFGRGVSGSIEGLNETFAAVLNEIAENYDIKINRQSLPNTLFGDLIHTLYKKTGQKVVVLVDEYDKPILDNIDNSELALAMREALKDIYSVIKDSDKYIKFVLLTGVSKFSKVGLFSGLNNLKDITLDNRYATLCGYTEAEIKECFAEHLHDVDFEKLRQWYNGYNFLGEKVYNPFDVLLYLDSKQFKNYWFETGSPSFLLKLIRERQYTVPNMENIFLTEADLGSFDVNDITLETLLFQTGYLTIESVEDLGEDKLFYLKYPNLEVKMSLNQYLLRDLTHTSPSDITRNRVQIYRALQATDFKMLEQGICAIFASIPHDWHRKNQLSNYEGYYASIVYSCFCALGLNVIAEDSTNQGQIDLTVMLNNQIFIIEFKVIAETDKQGTAFAQIKAKNYQQKYLNDEKTIFLVGMEFDKQQRNLTFFEWEKI